MESISKLVLLVGGWSAVLIAVSAFVSKLVTERVLSKWRRDEQREMEMLRSELTDSRAVLDAAIRGFASGEGLSHQKRIEGVDALWAAVLELRHGLSGPVFFYGILLPSEYDDVLQKDGAIAASISGLSDSTMHQTLSSVSPVERQRPFVGETLWLRFFIYRAFLGRLAHLIVDGKRKGHIPDWRDDSGVGQLLGHVLQKKALEQLLQSKKDPTAINRALNSLESLILEEMSLITSGQRSSLASFENARQLRDALSSEKVSV
jgi:hypothetical protein